MQEVDFNKIITHLHKYGGKEYKDPESISNNEVYLDMNESGKHAIEELNKLADRLADRYDLKSRNKTKWLYGGHKKIRTILWNQLKRDNCENDLTSMTVSAEKRDEQIQFLIFVKLLEKRAQVNDLNCHHRILDRPLAENSPYNYYIKRSTSRESEVTYETASKIKDKLKNGEYIKAEVVYCITDKKIKRQSLTNEMVYQRLEAAFGDLLDYYNLVTDEEKETNEEIMYDGNMILYGPPGTGKTYNTVIYAVAIIEGKSIESLHREEFSAVLSRYHHYKRSSQISFTTFHQSFGYEEFIEGIKPVLDEEQGGGIQYKIESGIFKDFCEQAQQLKVTAGTDSLETNYRLWKISLGGSGMNDVKEDCFKNNRIRIGWDSFGEDMGEEYPAGKAADSLYNFYEEMSVGDIVFSLCDRKHIDGIGIITGNAEWLDDESYFKRSREVNWIATNIHEYIYDINGNKNLVQQTIYELKRISKDAVNELIIRYSQNEQVKVEENKQNYVFIIDEINRGNISKILGELITLLEPTKRLGASEQMKARLPYSQEEFGIPQNVYILGTMNTADRSIAMMDTALRRRFRFIEMMPDEQLLKDIKIGSIEVHKMLYAMNRRIEMLYDREHMIGHAYFMELKNDATLRKLGDIFRSAIIPLLQEYFFEDYEKIQLVLGDNNKADDCKFVLNQTVQVNSLFRGNPNIDVPEYKYTIQLSAFNKETSYLGIYE